MRSYRRQHIDRGGRNNGSFWLSFSDLMSSLLLIIILIMFYIMYQYFDMYEINRAEIARRQFELEDATKALEEQQAKLTEAEEKMIAQQIRLNAAEDELKSAEDVLADQKQQLADAQTQLSDKEAEIASQQEKLDALSAQLGIRVPFHRYGKDTVVERVSAEELPTTYRGMEIASQIYARHRALTNFFIRIGVSPEQAREDACKIEHDISQETFEALCRYAGEQA